jgi:hypothetical protein
MASAAAFTHGLIQPANQDLLFAIAVAADEFVERHVLSLSRNLLRCQGYCCIAGIVGVPTNNRNIPRFCVVAIVGGSAIAAWPRRDGTHDLLSFAFSRAPRRGAIWREP